MVVFGFVRVEGAGDGGAEVGGGFFHGLLVVAVVAVVVRLVVGFWCSVVMWCYLVYWKVDGVRL